MPPPTLPALHLRKRHSVTVGEDSAMSSPPPWMWLVRHFSKVHPSNVALDDRHPAPPPPLSAEQPMKLPLRTIGDAPMQKTPPPETPAEQFSKVQPMTAAVVPRRKIPPPSWAEHRLKTQSRTDWDFSVPPRTRRPPPYR